ncbi:hypothetical protein COCCADRAFT_84938, partial [Bipolaris zeicola 26-R-13]
LCNYGCFSDFLVLYLCMMIFHSRLQCFNQEVCNGKCLFFLYTQKAANIAG